MASPSLFLTRRIWSAASEKHIHVITGAANCNGFTTIPIEFDNALHPSSILIYGTNSNGQYRKEHLPLGDLRSSPPDCKDQLVMILRSTHQGCIFQATAVSRKYKTATVVLDGKKWEEKWEDLCMVDDHKPSRCLCEKGNWDILYSFNSILVLFDTNSHLCITKRKFMHNKIWQYHHSRHQWMAMLLFNVATSTSWKALKAGSYFKT